MFTKLKDFKNIRKSMHLFSNDEGEESPGKQGKRLKSTASLQNKKNKGKQTQVPPSDSDVEPDNQFEDAAVGQDRSETERPQKQKKNKGKRTQEPVSNSEVEPDNRTEDVAVGYDGTGLERPQKQKKSKGRRTQELPPDSDVEPDNWFDDAAVGHDGTRLERPQKEKKNKGKRIQLPATDSEIEPDNRTEDVVEGYDGTGLERPQKEKKNKGKRIQLPATDSEIEPDNRTEDVAVGQYGTGLERPHKLKKSKGKRTQEPATDSEIEPDNRTEDVAVGQYGTGLERPQKLKKSKGKRTQEPATDSDVEPGNRTEEAAAGQDGTWIEHPQKRQPPTQHSHHHDYVTSSSEASVPLSSSTQASSPISPSQSPLRRLKQAFRRTYTRHSESPPHFEESPSPNDSPSDPRTYDQFQPVALPNKFPKIKGRSGATTANATDTQEPPPTVGAPPSQPPPDTRQLTAAPGTKPGSGVCQQRSENVTGGEGNKKRIPPGAVFNPSKHRHTWPCEMIPINVPSPENAQAILHPRKDVFVLKVAKISANGDRRIKMELELVTPKYGKKMPSRLDTREAQCDPECCCPCVICPKPKRKKKC